MNQAPLSSTISWSLLKFMSFELVMLSNHCILCHPLFLLLSNLPSIRVFSKPVNPKWDQPWIFIGRMDAEVLILWSSDAKELTHWKRACCLFLYNKSIQNWSLKQWWFIAFRKSLGWICAQLGGSSDDFFSCSPSPVDIQRAGQGWWTYEPPLPIQYPATAIPFSFFIIRFSPYSLSSKSLVKALQRKNPYSRRKLENPLRLRMNISDSIICHILLVKTDCNFGPGSRGGK